MASIKTVNFIDNPAIASRREGYLDVTVNTEKVLKSWKRSLYAFEWMLPDGRIRSCGELPEAEQPRRRIVEEKLERNEPLEKPVLGIGLLDTVEIGAGRATFLTLAALGLESVPVHIPQSSEKDFTPFLSRPARF